MLVCFALRFAGNFSILIEFLDTKTIQNEGRSNDEPEYCESGETASNSVRYDAGKCFEATTGKSVGTRRQRNGIGL